MFSVFKTLFLTLALLTAVVAHAQAVRWEPASGTLEFNQLNQLSLVFDQCEPKGDLKLPAVAGLNISTQPSVSRQIVNNVVNFQHTASKIVTLTFGARPIERRTLTIPAFQVNTDKGPMLVAESTFQVGDPTVGQSSVSLDSVVNSRISAAPSVWAGEVFPVTYSVNAARRYFYQLGGDPDWSPAPLTVEPWAKPELLEAVINDDPRISVLYKTRAYAKAPGAITLNSVAQLINLSTGSSGFSIFARPTLEQRIITAPPSALTVKPLPSPAPAGFTGAVGQFTLDSKIVPATAKVGEPITWTLTLDGTGNWPDIAGLPPRNVSNDFTPITPQAKRTNKNDALFDASFSEDVVLIPTKPGTYTLGPVAFSVFNPATGAYENLSTKPVTITVGGAAPVSSASSSLTAAQSDLSPPSSAAPRATAPAALPRDPLPPAGTSFAPLSSRTLLICLLSSVLCPLSIWLVHALRRARRTDPALLRREARIRLSTTISQLSSDSQPSSLNTQLIQSWQRDTAILWNLPQAVPTVADFSDERWAGLWADSDRTLYGATPLPAEWPARATAALSTKPVPSFSAFQLFLPRNLLPLLIILSAVLCSPSSASEGVTAYSKADYPAAEKAWRAVLASSPADWAAHHNLALALIQQNRSGEAAGHALAAFVQQPQNDSVRRTLAYAYKSAGISAPPVTQLSTLNTQLASLASPTRWQAVLIASAWLGALATALGIHAAYAKRPRKLFVGSLLAASLLLAVAGGISLRTYGPLADARAVVVVTPSTLRSIPTDLDTQKTTPLSLGVIASADKTFLGWTRLRFSDGQTGWTRTETLVALWK